MSACQICNTTPKDDLFSAVTRDSVCAICKIRYIGGLPTTPDSIALARERLGLKSGEFMTHDRAQEARRILGGRY